MRERPEVYDHRGEVREFLTSRRARLRPQQVGLLAFGENRRVPGLRRAEVATLAGVSIVYYTRLERGNLVGASDSVLDAIAAALQLDDAEREHLFDLARTANSTARSRSRAGAGRQRVPNGVQQVLDAITDAPADVRNGRRDILAEVTQPPNVARFTFLNAKARDFFVDWDGAAPPGRRRDRARLPGACRARRYRSEPQCLYRRTGLTGAGSAAFLASWADRPSTVEHSG